MPHKLTFEGKSGKNYSFIFGAIAFLLVMAVLFYVYIYHSNLLQDLVYSYGYLGIFIVTIIANSTIIFPLPIDLGIIFLGGVTKSLFDAVILGIVVGIGAAIGEMTAYALGLMGRGAAEKILKSEIGKLDEIQKQLKSSGTIFIFLGAAIPFPFDLIGISAGLIKFDIKKFFFAAACGKTIRYTVLCIIGLYGLEAIKAFFFGGG